MFTQSTRRSAEDHGVGFKHNPLMKETLGYLHNQ